MKDHLINTGFGLSTVVAWCVAHKEQLLNTVILSAIGATVSFGVSYFWKWMTTRKTNRKFTKK